MNILRRFLKPKMSTTPDLSAFNIVKEGKAEILFPIKEDVFYNPVQQFNRDLSVTAIRAWSNIYGTKLINKSVTSKKRKLDSNDEPQEKQQEEPAPKEIKPYISILEALSATGLRAIRYAKEIPHVKKIVANDFLEEAVKSINRNIEHNSVGDVLVANKGDANAFMYESKSNNKFFNVIDLDPYGTATPFIDAAIQNLSNDGLLLVTCTDLAVLAGGGYPEKCYALYGGSTLINHDASHEAALRLVLGMIGATAAKYKKTIEPVLSLSIDFYVRLFIRVRTSPIEVKKLASKTSVQYVCSGCASIHDQPLGKVTERDNGSLKFGLANSSANIGPFCSFCGYAQHVAGPMYNGPLHNNDFLDEILRINSEELDDETYKTRKRIEGMVTLARNEIPTQFYFKPEKIASVLKCQVPPLKLIISALGNLGYDASLTHATPSAIKTDASWDVLWAIFKEYVKSQSPVKLEKFSETQAGYKILTNENIKLDKDISFEKNELSGKIEKLRRLKIVRYQENPTKGWGPKAKPQ